MSPEELREMIATALDTAAGSLKDLADEVGVTYATLKAWADGRRNPSPENLARLADAIEKRGGELVELADRLREEVEQ